MQEVGHTEIVEVFFFCKLCMVRCKAASEIISLWIVPEVRCSFIHQFSCWLCAESAISMGCTGSFGLQMNRVQQNRAGASADSCLHTAASFSPATASPSPPGALLTRAHSTEKHHRMYLLSYPHWETPCPQLNWEQTRAGNLGAQQAVTKTQPWWLYKPSGIFDRLKAGTSM